MSLLSTTRMAIQAALAVALVLGVNHFFGFDRPIWGVLMAVVVISGAWGENLGKLKGLLIGTALAVVAALAFIALGGNRPLPVLSAGLICLFFWAYFGPVSYARSCAWMGAFAIIVVTYLRSGQYEIVWARAIQVGLGGGIGILVSAFVLPVRSVQDLLAQVDNLLKLLRESAADGFAAVIAGLPENGLDPHREHRISRAVAQLLKLGRTVNNETIVFPSRRRQLDINLEHLRRLGFHLTDLLESLNACRGKVDTPGLKSLFGEAAALVEKAFASLENEAEATPWEDDLAGLRDRFQVEVGPKGKDLSRRELAPFLLVFFCVRGVVEAAAEVSTDLNSLDKTPSRE